MAYYPINIEKSVRKECERRRYSEKTIKTYLYCIDKFLKNSNKSIDKTSKKDVRLFLEKLSEKNLAGNTLNVYHMAIKFLFEDVLRKKMWIDIKYSKVRKKIPTVLTKEEITRLFESIKNKKHKLMIELLYSAGLRVSELVDLKVEDLDFENSYGFVRKGKGNKDRLFILADKLKPRILELVKDESLKKENNIFTSQRGKKYNVGTIQIIIKDASKKAKISKRVTPHTLRHSFATHLIENCYSVSDVQTLLGHKSPETTMIYLHTSTKNMINIKSPLDKL